MSYAPRASFTNSVSLKYQNLAKICHKVAENAKKVQKITSTQLKFTPESQHFLWIGLVSPDTPKRVFLEKEGQFIQKWRIFFVMQITHASEPNGA